jgi:hypothetical protein
MSITQQLLTEGNVALWHNYISGSLLDLSSKANDGAFINTPFFSRDGINLNGTDNGVLVANAASLNFGDGSADTAFSLVWHGRINMSAGAFALINKNVAAAGAAANEYSSWVTTGESLILRLFDASESSYISAYTTAALTFDNAEQVLVLTYDGSSTSAGINIYVNGLQEALTVSDSGVYTAMENLGNDSGIGKWSNSYYTEGAIANAMVLSKELTELEVAQLTGELLNNTY